jgi:hypothetical protein
MFMMSAPKSVWCRSVWFVDFGVPGRQAFDREPGVTLTAPIAKKQARSQWGLILAACLPE